jgi:hypothetical protein
VNIDHVEKPLRDTIWATDISQAVPFQRSEAFQLNIRYKHGEVFNKHFSPCCHLTETASEIIRKPFSEATTEIPTHSNSRRY